MDFCFTPIATIRTPYPEKFSVPRQPGLVTADNSRVDLNGECNRAEIVRGLEEFSHIWLVWVFHQVQRQQWKPTVRPPRLGGNRKVGVFASRSPFRPNPIGLSVVQLHGIDSHQGQLSLRVSGADLVDGTPILDIKPYLPYSDARDDAVGGYANREPDSVEVHFSQQALQQIASTQYRDLQQLITQVLAQQPRPAYHDDSRRYGTALLDLNVRWHLNQEGCLVESVCRRSCEPSAG